LISDRHKYRLVEMNQSDRCCGMGGSFGIEHYELSNRIGNAKLTDILATNCDIVASGCPACMMQLSHILSKSQSRILVKHPIEIYAEKIG
ncbi:MAG: (Fe-S)-binding protein, partial [Proteobacteria bacterium]|nr:(Fe-S)-binding protein [Pseudomonadota bacterium]